MSRLIAMVPGVAIAALVSLSSTASEPGAAQDALGSLSTRATADVGERNDALAVTNATHPYFAGERIATRAAGTALLTLQGGAVMLAPDTAIRVERTPERYGIALERGAVRVRFDGGIAFEIAAGGAQIRPRDVREATATPPAEVDAAVATDGSQAVSVTCRSGSLVALDAEGAVAGRVEAGETRSFAIAGGSGLPHVATEGAALSELLEAAAPWLAGGIVVGGVTYGTVELTDGGDDSGDDAPVTSDVD